MPEIAVAAAALEHVPAIADAMRRADAAEVWASAQVLPREALERSLECSPLAWTGLVDGIPVCMFGASRALGGGRPWLLGTDAMERHSVAFLRRNRAYVEAMLDRFGALANHVDARNATSIRWLRWLGFTIAPAAPWGALGLPFHPFEMRSGDV